MADEQTPIRFFRNLASLPNDQQDGAIYISQDSGNGTIPINMYVDIGEIRYKIKPSYKASDIEGFNTTVENIVTQHLPGWLKYVEIEPIDSEDDNSRTLKIYALDDNVTTTAVTLNGNFLTLADIGNGTENGTFLVGEEPIYIGGLGSAAYTSSESYIPSNWSDLGTGGE